MLKITGTIVDIQQTTTSKGFDKRLFWLLDEDEKYPNTFELECWKTDVLILDDYQIGDKVTCYIDLKGKKFMGRDNMEKVKNSMKCWNIEKDGKLSKKI